MTEQEKKELQEKSWKGIIKNLIITILIAVSVGIVIRIFAQPTRVSGHSMDNTLSNNDFVLTNRLSANELNRGDIIVAKANLDDAKLIIKRVIALPKDKIVVRNGEVFLNNKKLKEDYIKEKMDKFDDLEIVVPEGYIFVMGDNRNNSLDSRSPKVGLINIKKDVIGKCFFDISKFKSL